jgi:acyl carrier protein
MSLFEQLQTVLSTTLKVPAENITPETISEDIPSWDSLGQINLILALEEFANLNSVAAIEAYLRKAGAS